MGHGKPLHGNFKDNACWGCCWYKVTKDTNSPERYFTHKNVQFTTVLTIDKQVLVMMKKKEHK